MLIYLYIYFARINSPPDLSTGKKSVYQLIYWQLEDVFVMPPIHIAISP